MTAIKTYALTAATMVAFAANSIFCRIALKSTEIDAASFTSIRIISGAIALWLLLKIQNQSSKPEGSVRSALALFTYAACFSFAYVTLDAGCRASLNTCAAWPFWIFR